MRAWKMMVLAAALAGCASAAAQPETGAPDWLSGYWLSCEGEAETAESWIGAERGVLLGTNITRARGVGYEFLRIAPNQAGVLTYYSMPGGRSPPTEFTMVSREAQRIVFENPAHDFPQRIVYARGGNVLVARIEDLSGTQAMEWRFRRAPHDAVCRR